MTDSGFSRSIKFSCGGKKIYDSSDTPTFKTQTNSISIGQSACGNAGTRTHEKSFYNQSKGERRKGFLWVKKALFSVAITLAVCISSLMLFKLFPLSRAAMASLSDFARLIISIEPQEVRTLEKCDFSQPSFAKPSESIGAAAKNAVSPADSFSAPESLDGFYNETKYNVSFEQIMEKPYPIQKLYKQKVDEPMAVFASTTTAFQPQVLIIHTHGTEAYADTQNQSYRSKDKSKNVVAVGKALCEQLKNEGIFAIHCEKMFDEESYIKAYSASFSAVSEYLSAYPSIKYVIDLHRDAIADKNGIYNPLLTEIDGKPYAKLMMVIGTDEAGASNPDWQKNLRTACGIQAHIESISSGLMRKINLRRASFNQQLCDGYFILEVGSCGNSLEQAIDSARLFAKGFSLLAA